MNSCFYALMHAYDYRGKRDTSVLGFLYRFRIFYRLQHTPANDKGIYPN